MKRYGCTCILRQLMYLVDVLNLFLFDVNNGSLKFNLLEWLYHMFLV